MLGADIAVFFYRQQYDEKIGPNLTDEQKHDILQRMSDLTLYEPFQFTGEDYSNRFPELKPYVNTEISGLYMLAIMEGISNDLGIKSDRPSTRIGPPLRTRGTSPRSREVPVRRHIRRSR